MMAHAGTPADELFIPMITSGVGVVLIASYLRGDARLPVTRRSRRRRLAFTVGTLLLVAVFMPWVDEAASALFSVHMAQHLVLIVMVPVLYTYSHAFRSLGRSLPRRARHELFALRRRFRGVRWLATLPVAGVVFAVVLWGWHVPSLYDAAVANQLAHLLEHACFLGASLLLWGAVLDVRRGFLNRSILLFGTAFQTGLLGATLVLAPTVLYTSHLHQTLATISPLQDQQLAGLIMWVPAGGAFLVALAVLVLRELDGREPGLVGDV